MIKVIGIIFAVIVLGRMVIGPAHNFINNLVQGDKGESEERLIGLVLKHNPRVEEIQRILKDAYFDPGSVDGVMGVQTRRSIREFQKANQLRTTGKIDSATWSALNKEKGNASGFQLSSREIGWIGEKVFENECASKDKYLVSWNEGEDFLSVGIAHFIWYPEGKKGLFEESFPSFLKYAKVSGAKIPQWLNTKLSPACPWNSRDDFFSNQADTRLIELRDFLVTSKPLQAAFIVKQLEDALPLILKNTPEDSRGRIAIQFNRIASTRSGVYALADYVNFKGLGITPSERYQDKGWGLFQVLAEMKNENEAPSAIEEFVRSANKILTTRVANAPQGRNEQKWLPGWQKRVSSYLR